MTRRSRYAEDKAAILAILNSTDEPMTAKRIAQQVEFGMHRVWDMVAWMVEDGSIHMPKKHGSLCYYLAGPGKGVSTMDPISRILFVLNEMGPMRATEIAEHTELSRTYVAQLLRHNLRGLVPKQKKQVYIKQFIKEGNIRVHLYAAGNMPDAVRPKPLSTKERLRRQRVKLRADPIKHDLYKAKERRRHFKPKPDPVTADMVAMIFGRAPLSPELIAQCEAEAESAQAA